MYLAQLNIAQGINEIDSPEMAGFKNNIDRINALAEKQPGFIWRFEDDENNTENATVFSNPLLLVNMSVWASKAHLFEYVYNTDHKDFLKRKKEWFNKMKSMSMVFWYIDIDQKPTLKDAKERLEYIREYGETPYAFSFKSNYTVEDAKYYKRLLDKNK